MIILNKSKQLLGQDYSAYCVNFIANCLWMLGLLQGTEDKRINSFYMGQLRGFGVLVINWIVACIYSVPIDFRYKEDLKTLNVRNFLMTVHGFFFAFSFHYLEVPIVYTISNAGPVLVFVIDYILHHSAATRKQLYGIFIASIGITLAVNSHVIYNYFGWDDSGSSSFHYVEASSATKIIVALTFLVITVGWAYAIVLTKSLKNVNAIQVNFHQGIVLLICNSLAIMVVPIPAQVSIVEEFGLFVKVGLLLSVSSGLYVASVCMTKKSGNVTIIGFSTVVMGYGVSIIRYGETPNLIGVVGSACIGVGLLFVLIK